MDKWEDTVMKDKQIVIAKQPNFAYMSCSDYSVWVEERDKRLAKAQAKDTWPIASKAGEDKGKQEGREEEYKRWVKFAMMAGICLDQPQQLKRIIPQIKGDAHKEGFDKVVEFLREHWTEYDTTEAPNWVRAVISGTQQDIENILGKSSSKRG